MSNTSGRAVAKNVFYGFSSWVLPLGLSIVATPIVVRALGHDDYGIYALVIGFIAYSFNFNLGRAVTKYVSEYRIEGRNHEIGQVISASFVLNLAVGFIGMCAVAGSASWFARDVFLMPDDAQPRTVASLFLAGATIFALMLAQVFVSVIQGVHRFDVFSKLSNLNNIVFIGGNIVLALAGYKLIGLLAWNLGTTALYALAVFVAAKKLMPGVTFFGRFPREAMLRIANFSWAVIGYQALANIYLIVERSWITRRFGAENLTFYVVPMTIAIYLHAFVSSLTLVAFPIASELSGDRERLRVFYVRASRIVLALVVLLAIGLSGESWRLLTVWMGGEFAERSQYVLIVQTVSFAIGAVGIIGFQLSEGIGKPWFNFVTLLIGTTLALPSMIYLGNRYGLAGAAIARLIYFGVVLAAVILLERIAFGTVQTELWIKSGARIAVSAVPAAMIVFFSSMSYDGSFLAMAVSAALATAAYAAMLWITGFFGDEDVSAIKSLLRRSDK